MQKTLYNLSDPDEFALAASTDTLVLPERPGVPPMTVRKMILEVIFHGIVTGAFINIHGETGTGKSAILETFASDNGAWEALCNGMGVPYKPLKVFPIEMVLFETPGELYSHRAIANGATFDEESILVKALREAAQCASSHYCLIWLREMGRVHSAATQGGIINLLSDGPIRLPNGDLIDGTHIAWVADSNYNADETASYTLVELDSALARRATINIPFDYLPEEEEERITSYFMDNGYLPKVEKEAVKNIIELGKTIREHRRQGKLLSMAPPTLQGYFAFVRMAHHLKHLPRQVVAGMTLLGSAGPADREELANICNSVFGIERQMDNQMEMGRAAN